MKKLMLSIILLLVLAVAIVIFIKEHLIIDQVPAEYKRTLALLNVVINSASEYYQELGKFPLGGNANVISQLSGKNAKGESFFVPNQKDLLAGVLVDGWKHPFVFLVDSNGNFVAYSCGPNRQDDGGKGDDIVYSTGDLKRDQGNGPAKAPGKCCGNN